jgi:hypothetical protein
LHFVVVGECEDVETFGAVLEEIPVFDVRPALEGLGAEFSDAQPGMLMRLPERFPQVVQRQQTLCAFGPG